MRRCWPKGTPPEAIPPDAEGIPCDEWRRMQPLSAYDDPVRRRDLERERAEQAEQAEKKRGAKR